MEPTSVKLQVINNPRKAVGQVCVLLSWARASLISLNFSGILRCPFILARALHLSLKYEETDQDPLHCQHVLSQWGNFCSFQQPQSCQPCEGRDSHLGESSKQPQGCQSCEEQERQVQIGESSKESQNYQEKVLCKAEENKVGDIQYNPIQKEEINEDSKMLQETCETIS